MGHSAPKPPPDVAEALDPPGAAWSRALGRPAARRIVEALREAGGAGMTAHDLAAALGQHHTGIRAQLAALRDAGVVEAEADAPAGRGRPAIRFRLAPDPAEREAAGHRELVRLLMDLVRQAGFDAEDVERFGEVHGRQIARPGAGPGEIREAFERLGFAPREAGAGAVPDLVLGSCPFADGVEAPGGDLICVLHRGLARGVAASAAPGVRVDDLEVVGPRTAGCRLRLSAPRRAGR
jgi:predicted ArsR family transcriptional regulator